MFNPQMRPSPMLSVLGLWVLLCTPSAHAQAKFQPTRMQRCTQDIGSVTGEERKRSLKECLLTRLDAERSVERDCRQQVRAVDVLPPGSDRQEWVNQCVAQALAVNYAELPRRQASVSRSVESHAASESVAHESAAPTPAPAATTAAAKVD